MCQAVFQTLGVNQRPLCTKYSSAFTWPLDLSRVSMCHKGGMDAQSPSLEILSLKLTENMSFGLHFEVKRM